MLVFLAGFILFFIWSFRNIYHYYQMMSFDAPVDEAPADRRLAIVGLGLCAVAWVWSLMTSLSLSRAAHRMEETQLKMSVTSNSPLDDARKNSALLTLPSWKRSGEMISRTFAFTDFAAAMKFVNVVAALAEQAQHHPDIDVRWNQVTLALTTHDAGGLTEKDFALARACDAAAEI